MTRIDVFPHYQHLFPTTTATYRDHANDLLDTTFRTEAWYDWIKACFRHPCLGAPNDDAEQVTRRLEHVCRQPVVEMVAAVLQ